ncbi:unnamed protein product, partial [Polarella glacialis]
NSKEHGSTLDAACREAQRKVREPDARGSANASQRLGTLPIVGWPATSASAAEAAARPDSASSGESHGQALSNLFRAPGKLAFDGRPPAGAPDLATLRAAATLGPQGLANSAQPCTAAALCGQKVLEATAGKASGVISGPSQQNPANAAQASAAAVVQQPALAAAAR